jgi:hypothetical protein
MVKVDKVSTNCAYASKFKPQENQTKLKVAEWHGMHKIAV